MIGLILTLCLTHAIAYVIGWKISRWHTIDMMSGRKRNG